MADDDIVEADIVNIPSFPLPNARQMTQDGVRIGRAGLQPDRQMNDGGQARPDAQRPMSVSSEPPLRPASVSSRPMSVSSNQGDVPLVHAEPALGGVRASRPNRASGRVVSGRVTSLSSQPARPTSISSEESINAPMTTALPDTDENWVGETYWVDPETGKQMVTKYTNYQGRRASVTLEIGEGGRVKSIIGGTAQRPGESRKHYLNQMSSFALWQLSDAAPAKWIAWDGEQEKPIFCYLIILATGSLLIAEIGVNGWAIEPFAVNPMFGPSPATLLAMGAKLTYLIVEGQVQRLIAPIFLHAGILHWAFNMIGLVNIGFSLEREFGTPKIATIFLVSGFVGVLSSAVFNPTQISVGASGAIFGLFGAAWGDLIQNWGQYKTRGNAKCALFQLTVGTVLNTLLGLMPILDQFAHLGGMLTGVSLGFTFMLQRRYTRFAEDKGFKYKHRLLQLFGLLSVPAAIIILLILIFVLYKGQNPNTTFCTWCHWINCIPVPGAWTCDPCQGLGGTYFPNGTAIVTCPNTAPNVTTTLPLSIAEQGQAALTDAFDAACNQLCI